ncbi:MAG: IS630 family transposase [Pseudomonadota bacterium]
MSRAYSADLRERVLVAVEDGSSARAAAARFGIGVATAVRWVRRWRETGHRGAYRQGHPTRSPLDAHETFLIGLVEATPDITLDEMRARLSGDRGVSVACSTIWRFFARRGWTGEKKSGHADEQARADVAAARQAWFEAQPDLDPERLIFIDETWLNTKMARLRGRAPRGKRLRMSVPHGHWKTTTFVAGLRLSGIDAPMLIDGPINGEIFQAYVDRVLVPTLRPGDVVIMDNLGSHKGAGVRAAIEAAGAEVCYLPPYSPDFNPIENAFAKLKALLRKAAARSRDLLWDAVAEAIQRYEPRECANYFAAAGYEPE